MELTYNGFSISCVDSYDKGHEAASYTNSSQLEFLPFIELHSARDFDVSFQYLCNPTILKIQANY
jgi:hypothetical protein